MKNSTPISLTDPKVIAEFLSRTVRVGDCWEWAGSRNPSGHGQFKLKGARMFAHRASHIIFKGEIPNGLVVDHICHNPPCVNPTHLRAVSQKKNMENRRGAHKNSKSGIRGVNWHKRNGKWEVGVRHNGTRIYGGMFTSLPDAEAAAVALRNKIFTHNDIDRRMTV